MRGYREYKAQHNAPRRIQDAVAIARQYGIKRHYFSIAIHCDADGPKKHFPIPHGVRIADRGDHYKIERVQKYEQQSYANNDVHNIKNVVRSALAHSMDSHATTPITKDLCR